MNSKDNMKTILIISEYLVGLACFIYVCFLTNGSISVFNLEQTAQSFDLITHGDSVSDIQVPSVTICDSKSYKFYSTDAEEFDQALLNENDIGPLYLNRENWKVTAFFNPFFGRCFTYTFSGFHDNLEQFPFLTLRINNSFKIFVHEEGWEILIQFDLDLTENIIFLDLVKESEENYKLFYFQYSTKKFKKIETSKFKCDESIQMVHFKQCIVEELWVKMNPTWKPYFGPKSDISNGTLLQIKEAQKIRESYFETRKLLNQLHADASNPSLSTSCTIPCNSTIFSATLVKLHKNAFGFGLFDSGNVSFQNYKNSTLILGSNGYTELGTEYIFMNIYGLFSAIGGNLGMFLGFSVYSIYQMISEKLRSLL